MNSITNNSTFSNSSGITLNTFNISSGEQSRESSLTNSEESNSTIEPKRERKRKNKAKKRKLEVMEEYPNVKKEKDKDEKRTREKEEVKEKEKDKTEETNENENEEEEEETENDIDADRNQRFIQHFLNVMINRNRAVCSGNEELVKNLQDRDVLKSPKNIEALTLIPRDNFVPKGSESEAFVDAPLRVGSMGFNISAPHMYALCLENLDIERGMSILDIGSGCGHFTALASYLTGSEGLVHGLDVRDDIIKFGENNIKKSLQDTSLNFSNITFFKRNCFLPTQHVYDRIHTGACCPSAQLGNLIKLLTPNGILVTPTGDKLVKIHKGIDGKITTTKILDVRYGDLIVPSDAEIKEAQRLMDREIATTILIPEDAYQNDFAKLYNNAELSDVTLVVENKKIYAHRTILGARSDFFKAMLFIGLKESKESEITLTEVTYTIFMDILKYIYCGDIKIDNPDRAIEIIVASNYFRLNRLKAICEKIIRDSVEVENAGLVLAISSQSEAWQLKSFVLDFIMSNYESVSTTKCFDDLSKPLLLEVTKEACRHFNKNIKN